jgi:vacuolar-type H+-ATPase subunit F/Vma7
MKIAIVADNDTINCFKLAGLENAYLARDVKEAEYHINKLLQSNDFAVIVTTDQIANRIQAKIDEVTEEREFPLIISVPRIGGAFSLAVDPINELIKNKTGIELKL